MSNVLKDAMQQPSDRQIPPFEATWQAAEARHAASKRRYRAGASVAAAAAVAVIAISSQWSNQPAGWVSTEDLLWRTSWVAPSDAWLPEREFDIYQDLPTLTEST
ncbi:MAG: hypothetical protein AAF351_14290 [Pseudomonadota bacterium]